MNASLWNSRPGHAAALLGVALLSSSHLPCPAAHEVGAGGKGMKILPASDEGEKAIKGFQLPAGYRCELVAAEPLFANPVSFTIDEQGRFYVAETFRFDAGVPDIRGRMSWLDDELASRSVEDRVAYTLRRDANKLGYYTNSPDQVRLVWDSNGDGKADKSSVFAGGFNDIRDGIGSGVLAVNGTVYYANIPHLWRLRDTNGDGIADERTSLSSGYGVRYGFLGHDSHGLRMGPDGRVYFSIGDRGAYIEQDGRVINNREAGAVYRCNPDGTGLELFHVGLRNPQELAFNEFGDLFTVDNNSDAGDPARVVYVAEGGDSGWRVGWQFLERPNARGSWLSERLCYEHFHGRAAYTLPPVSSKVGNGPSGLAYDPGTSLSPEWRGRFFLANFSGHPGSGIYSFSVKPDGAGFALKDNKTFWWKFLPTDIEFGYDGCLYASDWVNGWEGPGKGRIYRLHNPDETARQAVVETRRLFATGFTNQSTTDLLRLLSHADQRVRQAAQFVLVDRNQVQVLAAATRGATRFERLHGIWGLGQLGRRDQPVAAHLLPLLTDADPEVIALATRQLGELSPGSRAWNTDAHLDAARAGLVALAASRGPDRARYFAGIALGRMGDSNSVPALLQLLRNNTDRDPWLRHAAIMGLAGRLDGPALSDLAADPSPSVRLAAVVALRRLASEVSALGRDWETVGSRFDGSWLTRFLTDADPLVLAETVRAIHDISVPDALPVLAGLATQAATLGRLPATFSVNDAGQLMDDGQAQPRPTGRNAEQPKRVGSRTVPGVQEAILRRVANANYRVGQSTNAALLTAIAGNDALPESIRVEAITMLGDWQKPDGKDRVTGLWRPLPPRAAPAAEGLEAIAARLIAGKASGNLKAELFGMAQRLGWTGLMDPAYSLALDRTAAGKARVAALRYLNTTKSPRLEAAVQATLDDKQEEVRTVASRINAEAGFAGATSQLERTLKNGSVRERQAAVLALAESKDSAADRALGRLLDDLMARKLTPELQLEVLEAAGRRTDPSLKERLARYEAGRTNTADLASWRECLQGGNAEEGRKVFVEKVEAQCIRCHKIKGLEAEGGEAGPSLTGLAQRQNRDYILESILFPNRRIAAGFEQVTLTLKDGRDVAGTLKQETADTIEINSPEDGIIKVKKSNITGSQRGQTGMPGNFNEVLTRRELRDLMEYLEQAR